MTTPLTLYSEKTTLGWFERLSLFMLPAIFVAFIFAWNLKDRPVEENSFVSVFFRPWPVAFSSIPFVFGFILAYQCMRNGSSGLTGLTILTDTGEYRLIYDDEEVRVPLHHCLVSEHVQGHLVQEGMFLFAALAYPERAGGDFSDIGEFMQVNPDALKVGHEALIVSLISPLHNMRPTLPLMPLYATVAEYTPFRYDTQKEQLIDMRTRTPESPH